MIKKLKKRKKRFVRKIKMRRIQISDELFIRMIKISFWTAVAIDVSIFSYCKYRDIQSHKRMKLYKQKRLDQYRKIDSEISKSLYTEPPKITFQILSQDKD